MQSPFCFWGNWLNVKTWDLNVNKTSTYRRKGERETERERERQTEGKKGEYVFGDIFEVPGLTFTCSPPTFIFPIIRANEYPF